MSLFQKGYVIKGKTMNLLIEQLGNDPCTKVCAFGNNRCYKTIMLEEIGIKKNIACKDLIGNCYFKRVEEGL